ncbi:MAG: chemotaxis response regulator protein-glutamate methylesterase [Bryobacteraceae bacterium]
MLKAPPPPPAAPTNPGQIRVLIVDDSALVRQVLTEVLSSDPGVSVAGAVSDPLRALDAVDRLQPDVVTLDVEMPGIDGLSLLGKLMRSRPTPVVMISSVTESGCWATIRALELGAADFVTKPRLDVRHGTEALAGELVAKVKAAARSGRIPAEPPAETPAHRRPPRDPRDSAPRPPVRLVAAGASTGGTEALRAILTQLPADCPPVLAVQHMPAGFTRAFAARLDEICPLHVREAVDGDPVLPGQCLIAPGGVHMEVAPVRSGLCVRLHSGEPVNRHRPSVDQLFLSCARQAAPGALGILLTGMGEDGARGMLALHRAGCHTIAQDQHTSTVFGMPGAAIALGAADEVVPLGRIAGRILAGVNGSSHGASRR